MSISSLHNSDDDELFVDDDILIHYILDVDIRLFFSECV